MRAVVQRVSFAEVLVDKETVSTIGPGLLVFIGFATTDENQDFDYIQNKVLNLRVFPDSEGVMNLSVRDFLGEILLVSQFTLYADARKGRRPSYSLAAPPEIARGLWDRFVSQIKTTYTGVVELGEFQAQMQVRLINEGPVTILLDSERKF